MNIKSQYGLVLIVNLMICMGCACHQNKESHNTVLINPSGTEIVYNSWQYSQAVRVGDIIWVSGKTGNEYGMPVEGIEAQARLAFEKIEQILKEAGSSLDDVVESEELNQNSLKKISLPGLP